MKGIYHAKASFCGLYHERHVSNILELLVDNVPDMKYSFGSEMKEDFAVRCLRDLICTIFLKNILVRNWFSEKGISYWVKPVVL